MGEGYKKECAQLFGLGGKARLQAREHAFDRARSAWVLSSAPKKNRYTDLAGRKLTLKLGPAPILIRCAR